MISFIVEDTLYFAIYPATLHIMTAVINYFLVFAWNQCAGVSLVIRDIAGAYHAANPPLILALNQVDL